MEGIQKIVPGKDSSKPAEDVHIFLALVRLKQVDSDVMISLSIPHKGETAEGYQAKVNSYAAIFKKALASFRIVSLEAFSNVMIG